MIPDVASVLAFAGKGRDDSALFQIAADAGRSFRVPAADYIVRDVDVGPAGLHMVCDKGARFRVVGRGFARNMRQVPRAAFIAANPTLDGRHWYHPIIIDGGEFEVEAGACAVSDRVPFLVDTAASPSRVILKRNLLLRDVDIFLEDASSVGVGIHGGWGTTIRGGSITAAGIDALGVYIGGSAEDGDPSCHPQEITVDGVTFNSCRPFATARGGCTNAAEGLTVRGGWFNFVRRIELAGINSVKWLGPQLVTDTKSVDIVDCSDVTIAHSYFESNHPPDITTRPGVVNLDNCQDIKFVDNAVNVFGAVARDGILIRANATTTMRGVRVVGNRFQRTPAPVETSAIRFATDGGVGQITDITVRDNPCSGWAVDVNLTDHWTTLAERVQVSNSGLVRGVQRVNAASSSINSI